MVKQSSTVHKVVTSAGTAAGAYYGRAAGKSIGKQAGRFVGGQLVKAYLPSVETRKNGKKKKKLKGYDNGIRELGRKFGGMYGQKIGGNVGAVVGGVSGYYTTKKVLGSFKNGGKVKQTGIYKLHKGETVIPAKK